MPDDRPAPAVDRVAHFNDGSPDVSRQISATLLGLDLKKLVRFQSADGAVELELNLPLSEKLFPSDETQDPNQERLPEYQKVLWDFLLNAAGDHRRIAMKELRPYIHDNQETAWKFRSRFDSAVTAEYKKLVKTETVKRPFFSGTRLLRILPTAASILAMLICMFCLGRRFGPSRREILNQTSENDLALW